MDKTRKSLYLYPITKATFRKGGNDYIQKLIVALSKEYKIVNKQTSLGLLDVLLKIPKTDIIYLNWIEDIAGKRFSILQAMLLIFIIVLSKVFQIKIVWFIHNNLSHFKDKLWLKKIIVTVLAKHASIILSHSREVKLKIPATKLSTFHHPVEEYKPIIPETSYAYDLLIWGTVNPHKGVEEFLKFNYASSTLLNYKILIAGKFHTQAYFESLEKFKRTNIFFDNRILTETELQEYFRISRYVLFPYNSPSVLGSAALCKTLSYGKPIIGPEKGSFKELGKKNLIYNYRDFNTLGPLLDKLNEQERAVDEVKLKAYLKATSWACFTDFIIHTINQDGKVQLPLVTQ